MLTTIPVKRRFKSAKYSKVITSRNKPNSPVLNGRSNDPTGIAGSWSDNRSAEEIIATIHDFRQSKR